MTTWCGFAAVFSNMAVSFSRCRDAGHRARETADDNHRALICVDGHASWSFPWHIRTLTCEDAIPRRHARSRNEDVGRERCSLPTSSSCPLRLPDQTAVGRGRPHRAGP